MRGLLHPNRFLSSCRKLHCIPSWRGLMNAIELITTYLYPASWRKNDFLIIYCLGCFLLMFLLASFWKDNIGKSNCRNESMFWVTEYQNSLGLCEYPTRRHRKFFSFDGFTIKSTLMVRIWKGRKSENES